MAASLSLTEGTRIDMAVQSICFALLLSATFVIAADNYKEIGSGSVRARVNGTSGKVEFVHKGSDGKFDFTKAFTLEVDYVKQKNQSGKEVGKAVNNFESQEFTFSPQNQNVTYANIPVESLHLESTLVVPKKATLGKLELDIYIFKQAGNITVGNETLQFENGTLTIFIKLRDYYFCAIKPIPYVCGIFEVGKYVDLAIVVKSRRNKKAEKRADDKNGKIRCPKKNKCPDVFNFGDDAEMALRKTVNRDGYPEASLSGYPKAETLGSEQRFIFRASKFQNFALFEATVSVSDAEDAPTEEPTTKALASSIQLHGAMFAATLIALLM